MEGKTPKEILNKIYKDFGLTQDDIYVDSKYKIINRKGIDKIEAKAKIAVTHDLVHISPDSQTVVILTKGEMGDKVIYSFGESAPHNYERKQIKRTGKDLPYYPVSMAEKRGRARVVLRLAGLYELGFHSEDESDEFEANSNKSKNDVATNKAVSKLTKSDLDVQKKRAI